MMPVRLDEWGVEFPDYSHPYFQLEQSLGMETSSEFYTTPAPSEDIWKKFELDTPCRTVTCVEDEDRVLCAYVDGCWPALGSSVGKEAREIRQHDCMWAGLCVSEEHTRTHRSVKNSRESVCRGVSPPRPETPVSLSESEDDEHSDDTDSCWGTTGSGLDETSLAVPVSEVTGQVRTSAVIRQTTFGDHSYVSDHSYHLMKGTVKTDHLGVQTPSDSEEEIDVVTLGEKASLGRPCSRVTSGGSLPTNPSAQDRHDLQITVAAMAACRKDQQQPHQKLQQRTMKSVPLRITVGDRTLSIRTIPASALLRAGGKRGTGVMGARGMKRARLHYHTQSPRKRGSRSGSDSEDPVEKRSLHNNMERQRRIDLRNAFDQLRMMVPELEDKERAAKVVILRDAATFCRHLADSEVSLVSRANELRQKQEELRARVSQLRRSLAAVR